MSPLSLVHVDGSNRSDATNKKLVRAHVSKYFHPKKQGKQAQRLEPPTSQHPRLLAPHNIQPKPATNDTIACSLDDRNRLEDQYFLAPHSREVSPASFADTVSSSGFIGAADFDQNSWLEEDGKSDEAIEPAAVVDLLKSGVSREKNLRIGWLQEGRVIPLKAKFISSHMVGKVTRKSKSQSRRTNRSHSETQWRHSPRKEKANSVSPCPQILDFMPCRGLDNPVLASVTREARQLVESCMQSCLYSDYSNFYQMRPK
jgi:hypothetical protein